jgi:hypothetical protein
MAYWQEEFKRAHEEAQAKLDKAKRKPFDPALAWSQHTGWTHGVSAVDESVVGTAYAMLFLQDTLRSPVAAYWKDGERAPAPPLLPRLAQIVRTQHQWTPGFLPVSPKSPAGAARGLALILDSRSTLDAPESMARIKEAGLLLVDTADAESYRLMETKLLAQFEGSKIAPITKESPFLAAFEGPMPSLKGLYNSQGALTVVFVPSANATPAYLALKHHAGTNFFAQSYPVNLENANHTMARNTALEKLVTRKPEPPPPPAKPVAEVKPPPPVETPKAPVEEPEPVAETKPQPTPIKKPAADETW